MSNLVSPAVNIFIIRGEKLLLGRRDNTGWADGYLCPFGGHVEKNERPSIAIIREMKEELGVDIDPNDIEFLCVAARNTSPTEYASYEFIMRDKNYNFQNAEPHKCSELVWVDINNLPEDVIKDFQEIIEKSIFGQEKFLELGF